jgi:hypothetical protein
MGSDLGSCTNSGAFAPSGNALQPHAIPTAARILVRTLLDDRDRHPIPGLDAARIGPQNSVIRRFSRDFGVVRGNESAFH